MLPPDLAHDMLSLNQGERRCSREGAEMQPRCSRRTAPAHPRQTGKADRPLLLSADEPSARVLSACAPARRASQRALRLPSHRRRQGHRYPQY